MIKNPFLADACPASKYLRFSLALQRLTVSLFVHCFSNIDKTDNLVWAFERSEEQYLAGIDGVASDIVKRDNLAEWR